MVNETIAFTDPLWQSTFPQRISPLPDELLAGFLLRCDEANKWMSKTTLLYLKKKQAMSCLKSIPKSLFIIPGSFHFDHLAELLVIPSSMLLKTTYIEELLRLNYSSQRLYHTWLIKYSFRICPMCVKEQRLLRRILLLPYVSHCPYHKILLQNRCLCQSNLVPFRRNTLPFCCSFCGLHWSALPLLPGDLYRLLFETKMLAWYQFFFTKGTTTLIWDVLKWTNKIARKKKSQHLLRKSHWRKLQWENYGQPLPSLSTVVMFLIACDLTPREVPSIFPEYQRPKKERFLFLGVWYNK